MPRFILIDEFIVSLRAPPQLTESQHTAMRRALRNPRFLPALHQAVRALLRQYSALQKLRVSVAR